jgi:hypothetical protein
MVSNGIRSGEVANSGRLNWSYAILEIRAIAAWAPSASPAPWVSTAMTKVDFGEKTIPTSWA